MDFLYFSQYDFGTPTYDASVDLRTRVLRKPLGLEFTIGQLEAEWEQWHLGAFGPDDRLIGCLVLVPGTDLKMRQVAIEPEWQGRGVGQALVAFSERLGQASEYAKMVLHARDTAIPFYERMGYQVRGKRFMEVGIPHYAMEKSFSPRSAG